MASRYCEKADLFKHGLPRGGLPNPGRLIAAVSADTEVLTLDAHGFAEDLPLLFRAEGGGTMPAPLVVGTTYYAKPLTDSTFQVAAAPGGSAINITSAGARVLVVAPLPFDEAIEFESARLDEQLVAHEVPLTAPYPVSVVAVVAKRAAAWMLQYTGAGSLEQIASLRAEAKQVLDDWRAGIPISGAAVPPAANLSVVAVAETVDERGWIPEGGGLP